jgi:Zn-dependent M28 family amino/carboxypeptidase
MKEYLQHELESKAETVAVQNFRHPAGNGKDTLDLTNLIARFRPRAKDRILLCAHWDTRPWADQDPVPENRKTPIPGANDGGSGVAILLALAGILHRNPPPCGVDIALFDGEDYGTDEHPENYLLGSTHFAQSLEAPLPRLAIVLDMVGDRDLKLFQERNSLLFAPRETGAIWRVGRRIAPDVFMPEAQYTITDDHLPLLMKGIPAVDVIDFDYPYWHTLQDTPDKCSPRSLAVVGQTVLGMIYR